jgi:hypothetical protein
MRPPDDRANEGWHEQTTSTVVPNPHVSLTLSFSLYLEEKKKKNVVVLVLVIKNFMSRLNLHVQTHSHFTVIGRVLQELSLMIFPAWLISTLKMVTVLSSENFGNYLPIWVVCKSVHSVHEIRCCIVHVVSISSLLFQLMHFTTL